MIRILVMIVLIVHGLIHLIGFVVPWRLATIEDFAYTTTLLAGNLNWRCRMDRKSRLQ